MRVILTMIIGVMLITMGCGIGRDRRDLDRVEITSRGGAVRGRSTITGERYIYGGGTLLHQLAPDSGTIYRVVLHHVGYDYGRFSEEIYYIEESTGLSYRASFLGNERYNWEGYARVSSSPGIPQRH